MVSGLTSAAYRMVGPIYGTELNLNASQIGLFLAGYVLGGAISQYPAGWLADKFDRRWVVIGISIASLISCTLSFFALGVTQATTFLIIKVNTRFFRPELAHFNHIAA